MGVLQHCEHASHGILLQVGLGTDVAGGYSPSMLNAMRHAVTNSKAVRMLRIDRARRASAAEPQAAQHAGDASAPAERQCPPTSSSPALAELDKDGAADSMHAHEQGTAGRHACQGPPDGACSAQSKWGDGQLRRHLSLPEMERLSIDGAEEMECLDYKGAFWLATMGGAEALGLQVKAIKTHECMHG